MQTAQGNMLRSLRAVQLFLDQNAAKLGDVVNTGARQRLVDAIAELSAHATDQRGSALASQVSTQKQRSLRQALLRDHMAPISRIARSDLPQTADIEPLRMPQGKPTIEKLSTLATGMAQAAIPFTPVFIAAGLPPDFIARLKAAAAAMESSVDDREQSRGRRNGATKGLKSKLAAGRKIVHILDAFVNSELKDDAPLLAHWNAIKRVQLVGRVSSPKTPPATPPATTQVPVPADRPSAASDPSAPAHVGV